MEAGCIIVCEGAGVSMTIKNWLRRGLYRNYDTVRHIYGGPSDQPEYADQLFMKTENLITFDTDDYIDDIKEVMASKRHRGFPDTSIRMGSIRG